VDESFKKKIKDELPLIIQRYEVLKPKRTAGWTSAVGTATLINAIKNDTKEIIPCNAVLTGEYGFRNIAMTVPAVVGKNGIEDIKILELAPDEQAGLKNTFEVLSPYMRRMEDSSGK
jgi:malate/lactate dehydrogenase